jgi:hypothetical protein
MANHFLLSFFACSLAAFWSWPGLASCPVLLSCLWAAVAFHLSKGLNVARVDHHDEVWTLGAINRSCDQIVAFVPGEDNHSLSISWWLRPGLLWWGCRPDSRRMPISSKPSRRPIPAIAASFRHLALERA